MQPLKTCSLVVIRTYQRFLSPFIPANCRYIPTCSEYMLTAIQQHGTGRGLWLGLKRIGRCHPLGGHGYDPVPQSADQLIKEATENGSVEQTVSQCGGMSNRPDGSLTGRKKANNG